MIATLREYVACDLNGKRAAENLHIHVNTAHYRLARISERTGCDLRRVADLVEILIAARLAEAAEAARFPPDAAPVGWRTQSRRRKLALDPICAAALLGEPFRIDDFQSMRRTMTESLAYNLIATAQSHPDRAALRLDDNVITYRDLDDLTARLAALLIERGLEPGDPVGVMLPNVPEFAIVYYAVLRAGGIVVPMNVLLKQREVAFYLGDSGARLIFAWHAFEDQARAGADEVGAECIVVEPSAFAELVATAEPMPGLASRAAEDTAVILYTSGTTGKPKGARAHALEPDAQRRCQQGAVLARAPTTRSSARCPCSTRSGRRAR